MLTLHSLRPTLIKGSILKILFSYLYSFDIPRYNAAQYAVVIAAQNFVQ
nr:MAG TPA: hypothetical protein [Bacteriophage sp.]